MFCSRPFEERCNSCEKTVAQLFSSLTCLIVNQNDRNKSGLVSLFQPLLLNPQKLRPSLAINLKPVGISRIEQFEKSHFGYYVRITRGGKQHAKFFSDARYGGQQRALKAAQIYFNDLTAKLPLPSHIGRKSSRNRSGIVGVNRSKSKRKGHTYEYWQAWWGSGSYRKSAKFSIKKYGTQKAKQLAIEARKTWEAEAERSHGS